MEVGKYVLDSFAVLAYAFDEPAADRIEELLTGASDGKLELHMSALNYAEVQYVILRRMRDAEQVLASLASLAIEITSVDQYLQEVVRLKAKYPISLADCFAVALAQDLDCPVVTGDPEFRKMEDVVKVEWLK